MFSLLVKFKPWGNGSDTISSERVFEYTEPRLADKFRPGGQLDLSALIDLPALFVQETSGNAEVARVGTITNAKKVGTDIALNYVYEPVVPPIRNQSLTKFASDLHIEDWEFHRTHWAVKDADLYRALLRNLPPSRQQPMVFKLAKFENIEPKLISAMMPFDPVFGPVYAALQETAEKAGFKCQRADDIWTDPAVIQDVVSLIDRSRVVICDCTHRNPNVFYEIGLAHTLGREVILITQSKADIPFDLQHLRFVPYLNNGEGLLTLSSRLLSKLAELAQQD